MNRLIILGAIVLFFNGRFINAQVNFTKVQSDTEMEAVWTKAADENLSVFVDIFATWCGPCKWMDANVFESEEAGNYLNNGFIAVKLDGESDFGSVFARQNGLQAYPSLFLFNNERKMMNMLVGAKAWDELMPVIQNTIDFFPVLEVFQNKYDSKLLVRDDYPAYIGALRKLSKDEYAREVVSRYRNEFMPDGKLSERDIKVVAFYTEPGTAEWNLLFKDIKKLRKALSKDLKEFVELMHEKTILTSVEDFDFKEAGKFNLLLPELVVGTDLDANEMVTRSHIYFYHYTQNFDTLTAYIDSIYAGPRKGDHKWLYQAAADAVFLDARNLQMTIKGIEWFTLCINEKETYDYYFHLGLCQYFSNMVDDSLKTFKKAGEFANDEEEKDTINGIISEIEIQL